MIEWYLKTDCGMNKRPSFFESCQQKPTLDSLKWTELYVWSI